MTDAFKVPDGYQEQFRRLMPYMASALQKDPKVFESLLLFLKLGGERLARVVIDAYNANQRQADIEVMRRLREEAFFEEQTEANDAEGEEEDDDEEAPEKKRAQESE